MQECLERGGGAKAVSTRSCSGYSGARKLHCCCDSHSDFHFMLR